MSVATDNVTTQVKAIGFFDEESKTFNGKNLSGSSLPFNKRVCIPECAEEEEEARLTLCRAEMNRVMQRYADEESKTKNSNLTKSQALGVKSLKERIKSKEVICFPTDKSGAMSIDTPENYRESMKPHLEGTIPATQEEYEKSEKLLNAHMQSWSRIMNFDKRVSNVFEASNNEIPPLYGLRKDHKYVPPGQEEKGPPQRPVCGAVVASNYRISHFISSIIRPIIEEAEEPCNSTEDFLSRIEKVNNEEDLEGCIIGSMDVTALYPSIDIEFSVDKCVELIQQSNVQFNHVNLD